MNAIKVYKQIESDNINIEGLKKYKGHNAEIIILINDSNESSRNDNKNKAFRIINQCAGTVQRWTRDELYDR